jgi:branched-subunit amino acid ABC-type transport system permease component
MDIFVQLFLNSIIAGSIYMVISLGWNLIFSTVKFFDIGYGALIPVGAYSVFFLSKTLGFPVLPAILLGIIVAGLIGSLVDRLVYRNLRKRKASGMISLVASLGILTAVQAIIAILFTSQFKTLSSGGGQRTYEIFGGIITEIQLIILITGLVISFGLVFLLNKTKFGKAIKAVADDEEVAKIVGIDTNKIIAWVFFIGSGIAGLAGILVGFDTGIEPIMGLSLLLKGVIAAIIGGVGNIYGGVLGAFLLGIVENFGIWQISGEWKDAIAFAVLIIFLVFRPHGILKK